MIAWGKISVFAHLACTPVMWPRGAVSSVVDVFNHHFSEFK